MSNVDSIQTTRSAGEAGAAESERGTSRKERGRDGESFSDVLRRRRDGERDGRQASDARAEREEAALDVGDHVRPELLQAQLDLAQQHQLGVQQGRLDVQAADAAREAALGDQQLELVVQQVVQAARVINVGDRKEVQVSLNLGALGEAEMELRKDRDGAVEMSFHASDGDTERALSERMGELRQRLLNRGLRVGKLNVDSAA